MTTTTVSGASLLSPEQVEQLVIRPVKAASVAFNPAVATTVSVSGKNVRFPIVTADPAAAFVAEGAEITPNDLVVTELDVSPAKCAGLSIISRELAEDSSPAAAEIVGAGLARDLARAVDAAFLGNVASPAPAGLASLPVTAGNVNVVALGATPTTLDGFATAIANSAAAGAILTAFVVSPADGLVLAKMKQGSALNTPLLSQDPSQPNRKTIFGVPVIVSPQATAGVLWGLTNSRIYTVLRAGTKVETDTSVFFTSDRVAVKCTMRVTFAFVHNAALNKLTIP
jgi:HK97 family phage major capsid protein